MTSWQGLSPCQFHPIANAHSPGREPSLYITSRKLFLRLMLECADVV